MLDLMVSLAACGLAVERWTADGSKVNVYR